MDGRQSREDATYAREHAFVAHRGDPQARRAVHTSQADLYKAGMVPHTRSYDAFGRYSLARRRAPIQPPCEVDPVGSPTCRAERVPKIPCLTQHINTSGAAAHWDAMDTAVGAVPRTPPRDALLTDADASPLPTPPRLSHVYAAGQDEPNTPTARPLRTDAESREHSTPHTSTTARTLRSSATAHTGPRGVGTGLRKLRACAHSRRIGRSHRQCPCARAARTSIPGRRGGRGRREPAGPCCSGAAGPLSAAAARAASVGCGRCTARRSASGARRRCAARPRAARSRREPTQCLVAVRFQLDCGEKRRACARWGSAVVVHAAAQSAA